MSSTPTTKLARLRGYWALGDSTAVLRLAASWHQLGDAKADIERGWAAVQYPEFYREMGREPDLLIAAGIAAVRRRYGLPPLGEACNDGDG